MRIKTNEIMGNMNGHLLTQIENIFLVIVWIL